MSAIRPAGVRRTGAAAATLLSCLLGSSLADAEPAACPTFESASTGLPSRGEWRTHPVFGDVNGDGQLDIAGNPRKGDGPGVWLGNGKGTWRQSSAGLLVSGFTCGVGVDFADVDGDGYPELGVADHCLGVHIFKYRPAAEGAASKDGAWQTQGTPATHRLRGGFDDLQFGDIDGDGRADLVATGAMRGGFAVLTEKGTGKWSRMQTDLPDRGYAPDVKLADIDGDGDLDIAAAFTSEERGPEYKLPHLPVVWLNDTSGHFRSFSDGLPQEGDFRSVSLGDLNGDGRLDLAISAGNWPGRSPLLIYLHPVAPDTVWRPAPAGHPPTESNHVFEGVSLGDLNGDGVLDLAAVEHLKAGLFVWRGLGGGTFEACTATELPEGHEDERGWGLAIGDTNGDGKPDIAYAHGRGSKGGIEVFVQTERRSARQLETMGDSKFPMRVSDSAGSTPNR